MTAAYLRSRTLSKASAIAFRYPASVSRTQALPPREIMPQIKAGKLIALAVTGAARLPTAPDLPTVAEQGYPGFEVTSWYGIVGPAHLPQNVVTKLNDATVTALRAPDVREQLARQGMDPIGSSPAEFGAHLKSEVVKWSKVIRQANIKAD